MVAGDRARTVAGRAGWHPTHSGWEVFTRNSRCVVEDASGNRARISFFVSRLQNPGAFRDGTMATWPDQMPSPFSLRMPSHESGGQDRIRMKIGIGKEEVVEQCAHWTATRRAVGYTGKGVCYRAGEE